MEAVAIEYQCLLWVEDSQKNTTMCINGDGMEFCENSDCWRIRGVRFRGNHKKIISYATI